MAAFEQTVNH